MNKKSKILFMLVTAGTVLAGCNNTVQYETFDIVDNAYIPSTYKGKNIYRAYIATPLKSLNTPLTMSAENAQHIANFVDGLLENDSYGRLSKALAEKVFVNDDMDEYTFYIRGGVENPIPWIKSDGTQYIDRTNGAQFVTGEDFKTAARYALDANNLSDCYYLPAMFIKGGYEYWAYTYSLYYRENLASKNPIPGLSAASLKDNDGLAKATNYFAKQYGHLDLNVTANDIPEIASFSRVGIETGTTTDATTNKEYYYVKYTLQQPASYFPSVLTYTPFLPVNQSFITNVARNIRSYGRSNTNFLYNGAFYLSEWSENKLIYKQNNNYWDKKHVHLNQIQYTVLPDNTNDDFIRKQFEKDAIDAFGVSQTDQDGWKKYVTGKDNKGSIENPVDERVYSREIDAIDSTFYTQLNVNREEFTSSSKNSMLTPDENNNANAALKVNALRELLLNGVDLQIYNKRYGLSGDLRDQYQMWTLVPKGFVQDSYGRDYTDYLYEEYATNKNVTKEAAAELLKQGQLPAGYADTQKSNTKALAAKAIAAIDAVNAAGGVTYTISGKTKSNVKITYPIKIEYLGLAYDAKQRAYDADWIEDFNDTVNACTTNKNKVTDSMPSCANNTYPKIQIVQNTNVSAQSYATWSSTANYHIIVVGWGADYADPLTYLNTNVTGGDMSSYSGTQSAVPDYIVNEDGSVERKENMLSTYDNYVDSGAAQTTDSVQRFSLFAKAEYELLWNVHLMSPAYMQGQGWSVTVSKLAGYETPSAAYGLSSYKLKGIYSLTTVMGGAERKAAKTLFETNKKAALADDSDYTIFD